MHNHRMSRARFVRLALGGALTAVVASCGGTSAVSTAVTGTTPASERLGQASITIAWPEEPAAGASRASRMLPYQANSIYVWFRDGQGQTALSRAIAKAAPKTTELFTLPVGTYILNAEARPNADGTGNSLAGGNVTVTITQGQTATVPLTLASAVVDLVAGGTDDVSFGQAAQFTITPIDASGNAVLVPPQDKTSVVVSGDALYQPSETKAQGATQYSAKAIGRKKGSGTVTVTLVEGVENVAGQSKPKVTEKQVDVTVKGWQPPQLSEGAPAGPRRVGHDPLYRLGAGWFSGDSETPPAQRPSPLETSFTKSKLQPGATTTKIGGWNSTQVNTSTGQSVDVEASARYMAYSGKVSTSMSSSMDSESTTLQLDYTIKKDFGDYWIDRDSAQLTPEACDLLYNDPETFKAIYGDQVVIGVQLAHVVHVKFSFDSHSSAINEQFGLSVDASGSWGTGSADFSGKMSSFLKSQSVMKGSSCNVETSLPVNGLSRGTNNIGDDGSINNLFAVLDTAFDTVAASTIDSGPDGALAIGYTAAPISYLVPAVPTIESPLGSRLKDYMQAWIQQTRALKKLDEIILGGPTGKGGHFYWAEKADGGEIWQRLTAARDAIRTNVETVLVPGIRKMVGDPENGVAPVDADPLTDSQRAPFTNWPKPRAQVVWATWTNCNEGTKYRFHASDYLRVFDAPGLNAPGGSDTPFWVQTVTGGGWTPPKNFNEKGSYKARQLADGTWEFWLGLEWVPKEWWGDQTKAFYAFSRDTVDQIAVKCFLSRSETNGTVEPAPF